MAWFLCNVGSGGGDGADLIVTCSSGFAGSTITCTDGSKTFTQTCPSSSPYTVTFESIPTGIWTISGVSGGQTFTETKTITDFTANLNDIPDGATVTPTDNIQTWLHCANIWDKNYTTISAVLADTTTLLALISSNNAVDYMARSTTWASSVTANSTAMTYIGANDYCANKLLANSTWLTAICNSTYFESVLDVKVPTMTSNTAPSGVVSYYAASYNSTYPPYRVFDGNDNTYGGLGGNEGAYIYDFGESVKVNKYTFLIGFNYGSTTFKYKLQGSSDNNSWEDIESYHSITTSTGGKQTYTHDVSNDNSYRYYRLLQQYSAYDLGQTAFWEMQMYGR